MIEKQLAELHDFKAKHRKGIGWDDVYVRHDRQAALAPNDIPWSKVTAIIGETSAPLAIDRGKSALVAGGFSKQIAPGILLYGQNSAGKLASLGVEVNGANPDFNAAKPFLQRIADELRLDLVDWYGGSVIIASQ